MAPRPLSKHSSLAFSYSPQEDGSPRMCGDPIKKSRWLKHLETWLPDQDACFHALITTGVLLSRDKQIVSSSLHREDLALGVIPAERYTFAEAAPAVYAPSASIDSARAQANQIAVTRDAMILSSTLVSPIHIVQKLRQLATCILSTMIHESDKEDYKNRCGMRGDLILRAAADDIAAEMQGDGGEAHADAIDTYMQQIIDAGLPIVDAGAWGELTREYEHWNEVNASDRVLSAKNIAGKYVNLFRLAIGELQAVTFDNDLRTKSARGDLVKVKSVIVSTINQMASRAVTTDLRSGGRALLGREKSDRKRPPSDRKPADQDRKPYRTVDERIAAGEKPPDSACPHCGKKGHWGPRCPTKPSPPSTGSAKIVAVTCDDEDDSHDESGEGADSVGPDDPVSDEPVEIHLASLFSGSPGVSVSIDAPSSARGGAKVSRGVSTSSIPYGTPVPADSPSGAIASPPGATASPPGAMVAAPAAPQTPVLTPQTPVPVHLSYADMRAIVVQMEPAHSLSVLRDALRRTGLAGVVSPSTGGTAKRTKVDIVNAARSAYGLPPLPSLAASSTVAMPLPSAHRERFVAMVDSERERSTIAGLPAA